MCNSYVNNQQQVTAIKNDSTHESTAVPCPLQFLCSLLPLTFYSSLKPSCRTESAQVLGVLSMMHTTARVDCKICRQRRHKLSMFKQCYIQVVTAVNLNLEPGNVERTIYVYRWDHRSTHVCGARSAGLPQL